MKLSKSWKIAIIIVAFLISLIWIYNLIDNIHWQVYEWNTNAVTEINYQKQLDNAIIENNRHVIIDLQNELQGLDNWRKEFIWISLKQDLVEMITPALLIFLGVYLILQRKEKKMNKNWLQKINSFKLSN